MSTNKLLSTALLTIFLVGCASPADQPLRDITLQPNRVARVCGVTDAAGTQLWPCQAPATAAALADYRQTARKLRLD